MIQNFKGFTALEFQIFILVGVVPLAVMLAV
jgi:hypothetical protein